MNTNWEITNNYIVNNTVVPCFITWHNYYYIEL